jgi:hypothetical protein
MNTVVLDAGALIALERRDRRALALLRELVALAALRTFPRVWWPRCGGVRRVNTW